MSAGKVLFLLFAALIVAAVAMKPDRDTILDSTETDDVTFVADDDPAMLAAFEKGRSTLDQFLQLAASPPPNTDSFSVKVAIADGNRKEYFWIAPFTISDTSFSGRISNSPRVISGVREGDEIRFDRSDVVDWTYQNTAEHKMHGNFTVCALLSHESREDAAEFKKQYGLDCGT